MKKVMFILAMLTLYCSGCVMHNCTSTCVDLTGTWRYWIGQHNLPSGDTITLEQADCTFSGSNPKHTIHGIVLGNEVRLTQLITGETTEGFARRVEGSYHEGSMGNGRISGMYTSSRGEIGSWVMTRQE